MSDPFDLASLEPAPIAPVPDYLADLNEAQRAAVEALDGPVLVLAGAGTGKTRVLTTRIAHLLLTGRAFPGQVLAVTFTNKAAREMIDRVARLIGRSVEGLWFGTFHSVAARILRRHAEAVGLKPNFTILDADDQLRLLRQVMSAHDIDEKRWPARALLAIIARWKDRGLTLDKIAGAAGGEFANGRADVLYRAYQERLTALNAADFGDLLLHCLTLFTSHADVLEGWQRRFRYILVDEYQDSNVAQYLWLRLLAQKHKNICCVGDDDQSIYGWRGAEVGNILRFEKDFPGAGIIRLERNYRSTQAILGAASGLIAHNAGRLGKTLWTDAGGGEKVGVRGVWDGDEEARVVGEEIEALQRRGHRLSEVAVLVRAGFQTRAFEERFVAIGLPYKVIGGLRFYERQEIRDAVAYMRVTVQAEDDLAFERIVNWPKRGLGDVSVQAIRRLARAKGTPLLRAARTIVETDELKPRARRALADLIAGFDRWRGLLGVLPHPEVVEIMLDEAGYTAMWQNDRSPTAPGRLENLKELIRALAEFENIEGFLEHVSLVMDADDSAADEVVNIMTLHGAKGLEFDTVFLPGWEDGLFPHQLALDENGAKGLEEERRLAYVGLTRARLRACVLFAANRRVYNQWQASLPSRFVDELPDEHVTRFSTPGVYESPGVRRETRRRDRRSRAFGAEAASYEAVEHAPDTFAVGARVFHQKFGYGRITGIDGNKLDIAFDKAGGKRVIDSFVRPA
ncbi:MAG: ATP-dependent helicase [Alphaproteobacteria bacterium]